MTPRPRPPPDPRLDTLVIVIAVIGTFTAVIGTVIAVIGTFTAIIGTVAAVIGTLWTLDTTPSAPRREKEPCAEVSVDGSTG